jgi:DNA polymerase III sliding clamp (beta) subunit (PCNA family)
MDRTEFIDKLKKLQPALSSKGNKPALECFYFNKETVTAYDGLVAIQTACETPFSGGINGTTLVQYLATRNAKELAFESVENGITIKVGKVGKTTFPILTDDQFSFSFPDESDALQLIISKELIDLFDKARVCMTRESIKVWQLGFTLVYGEKAFIYSTDNVSAMRVGLGISIESEEDSTIIPPKFIDCLIELAKNDKPKNLMIHKDWIQATFESGLKLWQKSVIGANADVYLDMFDNLANDEVKKSLVSVPAGMETALSSAEVLIAFASQPYSEFAVKGEKLTIKTVSASGESEDELLIDKCQPITVKASPKLIKRVITKTDKIGFNNGFIVLKGAGFSYLVSTVTEG